MVFDNEPKNHDAGRCNYVLNKYSLFTPLLVPLS
jgi:hypothetical protein